MKQLLIGIAAVAGLIGTPAFAADMALKAPPPPPPPVFSWTGCHIGVDVGGTWTTDKDNETVTATGAPSAFTPYPTNTATPSGVTVGGYAGCDYQFAGGFVLGAEGDGEWAEHQKRDCEFHQHRRSAGQLRDKVRLPGFGAWPAWLRV